MQYPKTTCYPNPVGEATNAAEAEFVRIAKSKGYTIKVSGDYSYRKPNRVQGRVRYIQAIRIDKEFICVRESESASL